MPRYVEVVEGDLLDGAALDRFFAAPQNDRLIVIHAASIVTMNPKPNAKARAVNVYGTRNIVEKWIQYSAEKLVYASSTGAVPVLPNGRTIREVAHHNPDKVVGYYGQTKAVATELVLRAARELGLHASVVYPSGILGPNDYGFGLITSCIRLFTEGKPRVSIGHTFHSADVRYMATGIITCTQRGARANPISLIKRIIRTFQASSALGFGVRRVCRYQRRPAGGDSFTGCMACPMLATWPRRQSGSLRSVLPYGSGVCCSTKRNS